MFLDALAAEDLELIKFSESEKKRLPKCVAETVTVESSTGGWGGVIIVILEE